VSNCSDSAVRVVEILSKKLNLNLVYNVEAFQLSLHKASRTSVKKSIRVCIWSPKISKISSRSISSQSVAQNVIHIT
jgi:hypothetical protein